MVWVRRLLRLVGRFMNLSYFYLLPNSVTTDKIKDLAVTAAKLAAGASASNLTADSITDTMVQALGRMSVFTVSGTFTASKTGDHLVILIGGGGGGAGGSSVAAGATQGGQGGGGGGGGGLSITTQSLVSGNDYSVTIGAGGAGGHGGAPGGGENGGLGGETVFDGSIATGHGANGLAWGTAIVGSNYGAYGCNGSGLGGGAGAGAKPPSGNGNTGATATAPGGGGGGGGGSSPDATNNYSGGQGGNGADGLAIILW